jgi:hypothetical protein
MNNDRAVERQRAETMDIASGINVGTLVLSVGAAGLSVLAIREGRNANQLPIVIDLLANSRDPGFMRREETLCREIGNHDAALGFRSLPDPIRDYAFEVGQYYQCLAYLSIHSIADFLLIAPQVSYRVTTTWAAIEGHVAGERKLRGGEHTFFNTFEVFVHEIKRLDLAALDAAALKRRRGWRRRLPAIGGRR